MKTGVPNLAATLGGWSARHRLAAVGAWLALVIVTVLIGSAVGQATMTQAEYGVGESGQATWTLVNAGIKQPADELVMVSTATASPANTAAMNSAAGAVLAAVRATGQVDNIRMPVTSASGRQVLVQFSMKGNPDTAADRVQPVQDAVTRVQATHRNVTIEQVGQASANKWFNDTIFRDFRQAEWTVVPLALGILLIVFGALLAALLPVALALTAFLAANGILALISHAVHMDTSASSVMMLMGMAVGVDYCLFYLRRDREERAKGAGRDAALRTAAATSGRSVLISGLTVMVAMAGMFLAGVQIFDGFAIATISVVLIAVVGSVTVLPALLSLLGDKVMLGRIPFLGKVGRTGSAGRFWTGVLDRVLSRPGRSAVLATGLLLALAAPALSMHTEFLNVQQMLPSSTPLVQHYSDVMKAFPGGPNPAVVVVKAPDIRSAVAQQQIAALSSYRSSALGQPVHTTVYLSANLAEIAIPLAGSGNDATSRQALTTLHDKIVPATVGKIPGGKAMVGGELAARIDWNNQMANSIVPVILFVMGITFVLMLVSFGSVVIAATSMALNLLSVGAAYGALTAVFVHGWGAGLIGAQKVPIESWIPLFVFVVLFGLSMDYNVFVVSRIKEAHNRGLPTREAVAHGIKSTAGVVTSAAIIMVAVFSVFGTLSVQQFKQLALGLAVSVLIDATVIRAVLLPSVMALLGDRNWYLPRWLSGFTAGGAGPRPPAGPPAPLVPDRPKVPAGPTSRT
jgi:RND superfamily putative drug exporter